MAGVQRARPVVEVQRARAVVQRARAVLEVQRAVVDVQQARVVVEVQLSKLEEMRSGRQFLWVMRLLNM